MISEAIRISYVGPELNSRPRWQSIRPETFSLSFCPKRVHGEDQCSTYIAALIVGAAMLMTVPTDFRILGYPGLAIIFFLAAGEVESHWFWTYCSTTKGRPRDDSQRRPDLSFLFYPAMLNYSQREFCLALIACRRVVGCRSTTFQALCDNTVPVRLYKNS